MDIVVKDNCPCISNIGRFSCGFLGTGYTCIAETTETSGKVVLLFLLRPYSRDHPIVKAWPNYQLYHNVSTCYSLICI